MLTTYMISIILYFSLFSKTQGVMMSGNGKEFSIEPIMSVVAATRNPHANAPCRLDPLLELIGYVLGRRSVGPSVFGPAFNKETVMTGLVLLRQHPQLAQVRFMRSTSLDDNVSEAVYQSWLIRERTKCQLPEMLSVRPAASDELRDVAEQAVPIVVAMWRAFGDMDM